MYTEAAICQYLREEIFPQLAAGPYGDVEVTRLSWTRPVYLFVERRTNVMVVGKCFSWPGTPPEEAWLEMEKEYWTVTEVIELFKIEENFLAELEEEEIICPVCLESKLDKVFTSRELERLRLAKLLFHDMGVNLPGVEVILRMRQNMLEMRKQFDEILEDLAQNIRERFKNGL